MKIIVFIAFLFHLNSLFAQDPHFTQHFSVGIYNNPAFTGSAGKARLTAAYRNQWPNMPANYQTSYLSFDISREKLPIDIGFFALNDRAGGGTLKTFQAGISLGRSIKLFNNVSLRLGVSGALLTRVLHPSKLTFGDQIDSRFGFVVPTSSSVTSKRTNFLNLNAGLILHSNRFLAGYSISNLNEPNQSIFFSNSTLFMRHTLQGAYRINMNNKENLSGFYLSAMYSKQRNFSGFLPGIIYRYKSIRAGLAYRNEDAYIINAAYSGKKLSIGYSYDYTISKLTIQTGGSHEITLNFTFGKLNETRPGIGFISSLF